MKNQMNKFRLKITFMLSAALILFGAASFAVKAQENPNPPSTNTPSPQPEKPRNLLEFLNLTPEQIQQIRAIQRENRPALQQAQKTQRDAQTALQEAIYAEVTDQNLVEQKIRQLTEAQKSVVEIRSRIEFRVRQVLNAEQLTKFKDLRQRFEQMRQQQQERQKARQQTPNLNRPLQNRFQNRMKQQNPANQELPNQPNKLKRN